MSLSPDDTAFLAGICANPGDETGLLVYADWLDERDDPRGAYLRRQVEFRAAPTDELRRRLIQLYPHGHPVWTATLEQAGAVAAN